MGSLLSGVYNPLVPIRPHHTSFRDFLTDESRSQKWFVDPRAGHHIMVLGCFRTMNRDLSFNICHLETSYVPNRGISDLEHRLTQFVPPRLSYAACSWRDHLRHTPISSDLRQELRTFSHEKLLFWFELLSLLESINNAASSLEAAVELYAVCVVVLPPEAVF